MSDLQKDNLMNSQWSTLFAFEKSTTNTFSNIIVLDTKSNFYSTDEAIDRKNRIFNDRSEKKYVSSTNSAYFMFDLSIPKKKSTKQGYLSSSVDPYRQGTEIRKNEHWSAGSFKLSAGTYGHLFESNIFGLNEAVSLTDNNYFQELNLFNPIEFISLQAEDKLIENVITFPIVTSDTNQRENYILNGVIEPFPIRPVISHFSINFPFEPHDVIGNLESGNPYLRTSTDVVDSVYNFLSHEANREAFLDAGERITVTNNEGVAVEVGPHLPYVTYDTNLLGPFNDFVPARGDKNIASKNYDSDLLSIIEKMPAQEITYLNLSQKSGKTGFVYNNSLQGVDSIAYGGLLR